MPQPLKTLIYVHRLMKAEEDVCLDRLIRAENCLTLAHRLVEGTSDEETLRAAIGRAYYSVHHALRAMALWQNKWDPDGHDKSISEFRGLLRDNTFRHRSGLSREVLEHILEARDNRHVADYSPYDIQREPPKVAWIGITNNRWVDAAQFNIALAEAILQAAVKCVGSVTFRRNKQWKRIHSLRSSDSCAASSQT